MNKKWLYIGIPVTLAVGGAAAGAAVFLTRVQHMAEKIKTYEVKTVQEANNHYQEVMNVVNISSDVHVDHTFAMDTKYPTVMNLAFELSKIPGKNNNEKLLNLQEYSLNLAHAFINAYKAHDASKSFHITVKLKAGEVAPTGVLRHLEFFSKKAYDVAGNDAAYQTYATAHNIQSVDMQQDGDSFWVLTSDTTLADRKSSMAPPTQVVITS